MTRDVQTVQTWYPRIFLACHTRHVSRRTSPEGLSPNDSNLLAHLDERRPISPSSLARHLGIGRPAASAAVKRLARMGYVRVSRDPRDARVVHLTLGPSGAAAMRGSSVLEAERVRRLLRSMPPAERRAALEGLSLLGQAAHRMMTESDG